MAKHFPKILLPPKGVFARFALFVLANVLAFVALSFPIALRPSSFTMSVGDVATDDIVASRPLSYTSKVLTEKTQLDAERSVLPVFLDVDPLINRNQLEKLRSTIAFINSVRSDSYASPDQKLSDLSALQNPSFKPEIEKQILNLSDQRWELIQQESLRVLEVVMRNTIREDRLGDTKRSIPNLISFSLPEDQAQIVTDFVSQFIVPNSIYNDELTQNARLKARNLIEPIERKFATGETIVRRGQIITPEIYEALQQYGLVNAGEDFWKYLAAAAVVLVISTFLVIYLLKRSSLLINDFRNLIVVVIFFLIFLYGSRFIIPNRTIVPYLYPLSAFGLTLASLFSLEIGLIFSLSLSILSSFGLTNVPDIAFYFILASFFGILTLGKARRLVNYFWAGLAIGGAGCAVILAYRLPDTNSDLIGIITLLLSSLINGLASASLALLFQYLFAQFLGLTTALQLLEISRPDHPLLQFMLQNAPGSYQHSLQVANLAEQAAEAIGADSLLVRIGAIYHDIGKALNPSFFIENQVPGKLNSHDDVDPAISAATIIRHIPDGLSLARKHRMPPKILDFIREHHGTLITRYQYTKAVQAANHNLDEVDIERFRYPGPQPGSRETALLMLADGCEARARAELPKDEEELKRVIKKVFDYCEQEGQLEKTSFTLKDLAVARQSFLTTLINTYHPRLQYPELRSNEAVGEPITERIHKR